LWQTEHWCPARSSKIRWTLPEKLSLTGTS
jgi:hypothetical protein